MKWKHILYAIINFKSKHFGGMTIFSKIIAGEIPSYKIDEDEQNLAFLDAMPLVKGHTLVIPKVETDFLFDSDWSM